MESEVLEKQSGFMFEKKVLVIRTVVPDRTIIGCVH